MAGWTALLIWADQWPVERRGILVLTLVPVLAGIIASSIAAVATGVRPLATFIPLWTFNAVLMAMHIAGYLTAGRVAREGLTASLRQALR
jgi:hypothetical protein